MKTPGWNFIDLSRDLLRRGHRIRFQTFGYSMQPEILHGDIVTIEPVVHPLSEQEIVLYLAHGGRPVLHRIIESKLDSVGKPVYLLRGDAHAAADGWLSAEQILGRMVVVERRGQHKRSLPLDELLKLACRVRRRFKFGERK